MIHRAPSGSFVLVLSVALALEYEAVCRDPEQRIASGLSEAEVETIVTALCAVAEPVVARFLWASAVGRRGGASAVDALAVLPALDFDAAVRAADHPLAVQFAIDKGTFRDGPVRVTFNPVAGSLAVDKGTFRHGPGRRSG